MDSFHAAGVQEGEHLTAVVRKLRYYISHSICFVVLRRQSSGYLGNPDHGGDCSVEDQLRNVQQIQATDYAFAAILADGSMVAWGDPDRGGDCSAVTDQ